MTVRWDSLELDSANLLPHPLPAPGGLLPAGGGGRVHLLVRPPASHHNTTESTGIALQEEVEESEGGEGDEG